MQKQIDRLEESTICEKQNINGKSMNIFSTSSNHRL